MFFLCGNLLSSLIWTLKSKNLKTFFKNLGFFPALVHNEAQLVAVAENQVQIGLFKV